LKVINGNFVASKKIGAQIVVAHFDASVDARYLDDGFNGAVFKIVAIHDDRAFYIGKGPRHFGKEVPDVKADPSVNGVDIVGFRRVCDGKEQQSCGYLTQDYFDSHKDPF
jgi:hypothetical protein